MQQAVTSLPQPSLRARLSRNPVVRIIAGIACVLLPLVVTMALAHRSCCQVSGSAPCCARPSPGCWLLPVR